MRTILNNFKLGDLVKYIHREPGFINPAHHPIVGIVMRIDENKEMPYNVDVLWLVGQNILSRYHRESIDFWVGPL